MQPTTSERNDKTLDVLNSFLRGELSAVETYKQALTKIKDGNVRLALEDNLRSHEGRVELLKNRILAHGGQAVESSGVWGAFARLMEGGAKVFGEEAAINVLESGEDHGRDDYRRELDNLDADTRAWVTAQLIPAQEMSHDTLSAVKRSQTRH